MESLGKEMRWVWRGLGVSSRLRFCFLGGLSVGWGGGWWLVVVVVVVVVCFTIVPRKKAQGLITAGV